MGGTLHPPISGARIDRYRCSLPGLAEFTEIRREGTNTGHHWVASWPASCWPKRERRITRRPSRKQAATHINRWLTLGEDLVEGDEQGLILALVANGDSQMIANPGPIKVAYDDPTFP